ncbi:cardiolipin synthase [Shimia gijangensis]|uniref:Cardiolipin synthase n=1 Tax=Shimia gijangensis TaxID=1470563 RepID=A0A1M6QXZ1_9RHOB|nr:cardiolipin synthase [Shimia gijangensis]SHK24993.1 cardiolipin synthase [Shimia gijangensis]
MFTSISVIFLLFLEGLAIYFAYRAVVNSRTPQGSVAWVVFLLAAPYLAIISYLFLGHKRISGYVIARQKSIRVLDGMADARRDYPPAGDAHNVGYPVFEALAAAPVLSGNSVEMLVDGDETFDAIFEAIAGAESYVLVQFYIIRDDTLGRAFRDLLIETAARGITVRVLYDSVGSSRLPNRYIRELTDAGVKILDSNALRGPTNRLQINFRNHRKTVIVDGVLGFSGGHNIGDEYLGRDAKLGHWRDTHCQMHGPIVSQLQLVFCEDWHWATEENLLDDLNWKSGRASQNIDALLLASGPADEMETGNLYFCAAIRAAQERIWIASPYFVPDSDINTALKVAALKGLDVRILMPDSADHWATYLAAFDYFDELRTAGVQFWRYDQGFMHQKVLLVDETVASVGTFNLDARSCRLNFETTTMMFDSEAARDVATMLQADFAQSHLLEDNLSDQPLWIRLGAPCARLFQPLL